MIKVSEATLAEMEAQHPGIREQIRQFEAANLPPCPRCGGDDTADVQVGIVGRSIYIAAATSKFTLIPNGPKPGRYFSRACSEYFG